MKVLPDCRMDSSEHDDPFEPEELLNAHAALEKQIQGLFQEVLGKEKVSTTANFFAEGGSQDQVMPVQPRLCIQHLALPAWPMSTLRYLPYTASG